jgi:hypothetical protein
LAKVTGTKRRLLLILLGVCLTFAIAAIIYLSLVPLDLTGYRSYIEAAVKNRTGLDASVNSITLKALPTPEVTVSGLQIKEGGGRLASAPLLSARLSLFQLLGANIVVKDLKVEGPQVTVERDPSGRFNIQRLVERMKRRVLLVRKIAVRGGRVSVRDEKEGGLGYLDITGMDLDYTYSREGMISYDMSATLLPDTRITLTGKGQRFTNRVILDGTGELGEVDLKRFAPYLRVRAPGMKLSGRAGIAWSLSVDKTIKLAGAVDYRDVVAEYPAGFKRPVRAGDGSARVSVLLSDDERTLNLSEIRLKLDGFDLLGSLTVSGPPGAGEKRLSISVKTTAVPFQRFQDFIPVMLLNKRSTETISLLRPVSGAMTVEELTVAGGLGDIKDFEALKRAGGVVLKVSLENLKFNYGGLEETFSGINGRVEFENDILSFKNMTGNYGHGVLERFSAEIKDFNRDPTYTFSLKSFFEAEKTLEIARSLYRGSKSRFPETLSRVEVSGLTGLNLNAGGSLKDPAPSTYSGSVTLKEARFSHPVLPFPLKSLTGEIAFNEQRLMLKDLSFKDLYSDFSLNAFVLDYLGKEPYLDAKAEGALARPTLASLVKSEVLDEVIFGGAIGFGAEIKGTRKKLSVEGAADVTGTDLKFRKFVEKAPGSPAGAEGFIELSINKTEDGKKTVSAVIKELAVAIGDSRAELSGGLHEDGGYRITLASDGMNVSDLDDVTPYLSRDFASEGVVSFNASLSREAGKDVPSFHGDVTVAGGRFHTTLFAAPVESVNASARIDKSSASLKIDGLSTGRSGLTGSIEILDMQEKEIRFDFESTGLYLEDFIKRGERKAPGKKEKAAMLGTLLPGPVSTGGGRIRVKKGGAYGQTFEDLDVTVRIDPEVIYIEPVKLMKNGGSVTASIMYYRDPTTPYLFDAEVDFSGIYLEKFIKEFGTDKQILVGGLYGTGTLWCRRGVIPFSACFNGEAYLKTERGKLWKFLFISKIFSIVNILSIDELFKEGLPYKFIGGNFSIRDGIISTKDLVLDSDSMRMSAVGEISIPDNYIDAILVQHPFVTIDKFLTSIPLAGWIIGGEKGVTLSMYYEIVGPLNNPITEPVPIKGLQEGVLGILNRLLEKPLEGFTRELEENGKPAGQRPTQ